MQNWLYNVLMKNAYAQPNALSRWIWNHVSAPGRSVNTKLHGSPVAMPADYIYPIVCRTYTTFNNPYLELVNQAFLFKNKKLCIVDAGAAIGDTFLFIQKNIPEAVERVYCIEANRTYLSYLNHNLRTFETAFVINSALGSENAPISTLQGITGSIEGRTLDTIWANGNLLPPDVLKTDVEGFDGEALAGATRLLQQYRPAIIFEFHPLLIQATGNQILRAFEVLKVAGYDTLLWYNKFGVYSHSVALSDQNSIIAYAAACINGGKPQDFHYDIIAVDSAHHKFNLADLANCTFARTKPFPC